jgi:DNA-binding transcriptional ArsR family regulator
MTEKEVIEILKALSASSRIQIIKLIRGRKLCVNAISRKLNITQSAVSQHLRILKNCNIVYPERYGSIIHYQLNKETIEKFINALTEILKESKK